MCVYLRCPRDVLQEKRQVLPAERPEHVPEPLNFLVGALEVSVLRVVLLDTEYSSIIVYTFRFRYHVCVWARMI